MKKMFLTLAMMLMAMASFAYDVEVDGIYYNLVSKAKIAEVTNGDSKYSGSVVIPEQITVYGATYSVTSIGNYAFSSCSGLTSVGIPNSVTSIGNYTFGGCYSLTSVHISDLAAWCGISFSDYSSNPLYYAQHLYLNGEEIKDLVIPNSVTRIGYYAFEGCSGLTSVTIPNSVTSIGDGAFEYCSGLKNLTLGIGLQFIGFLAFYSCKDLEEVTCYAEDVPSTGGYAFYDSYVEYATLMVPEASVEKYKAADPWSGFGYIVSLTEELGIETPVNNGNADGLIYDINGRRHNVLTKGLNIINGKKYILK